MWRRAMYLCINKNTFMEEDAINQLQALIDEVMAAAAPEGSQFDTKQFDSKMNELLTSEGQNFFTSYDEVHDSFDAMGLQENLLRGIYAYGFEKPSAIQQRGIVPFCKGLDVIQQAQSGTGKTATFCSGILQQLDYSVTECQALVLAPTRELAQQIEKVMRALGDYLGVKVHACVGGTSVREDQRILSSGVHVVVGTPGRVFDMLRRQSLRSDYIKMFVLDEADEMLSRGFKDQINEDEISFLTGGDDPYDDNVVLKMLFHPNLKLLIVTEGSEGCRYYTKAWFCVFCGISWQLLLHGSKEKVQQSGSLLLSTLFLVLLDPMCCGIVRFIVP